MTVPRTARPAVFLSLTLALCGLLLHAQEPAAPGRSTESTASAKPETSKRAHAEDDDDRPARPRRVVKPMATPMPVATPIPRKQGFFSRMFGRKKKPTPTPAPATPTPRPRPKVTVTRPTPVEKATPSPGTTPKPTARTPKPEAAETDAPTKKPGPTPKIKHIETPREPGKASIAKEERAVADALKNGDPDRIERAKYDLAKTKAMQDDEVRALRAKADSAGSDEGSHQEMRAYNRALFQKMRALAPEITDRIDSMEKAVLNRIGGGEN